MSNGRALRFPARHAGPLGPIMQLKRFQLVDLAISFCFVIQLFVTLMVLPPNLLCCCVTHANNGGASVSLLFLYFDTQFLLRQCIL
jgi:hypothetical protein